jgi:hypothetical protein
LVLLKQIDWVIVVEILLDPLNPTYRTLLTIAMTRGQVKKIL